jgi:RNA polymerase sigma-70 factor (ECF subfamily)
MGGESTCGQWLLDGAGAVRDAVVAGSAGDAVADDGATSVDDVAAAMKDHAADEAESDGTDGPDPYVQRVNADFARLYDEQFARVVALVLTLSGSRWAAEELAQDAFVSAYRHWDRIAGYDDAGAWVRRVAMNAAVSRYRRALAEARALVRLRGRRQAVPAEMEPRDEQFWAAVRDLPKQQARAVALHYLDDLSVAAIAPILGCSEATVKVHLHRGRRTLAERLAADDEGNAL